MRLDQGHQLGHDLRAVLLSDVLGKLDYRCRAVPVEVVGDEHVVPVPGQLAGQLPYHGPNAETVRVHQHPWVMRAVVGEGGEGVGLAVRGGNLQGLGGHGCSCRG